MPSIKRKLDVLSKECRAALIKDIIIYFETKRDQKIGVIAAEEILDFFLETLSPYIYNKAINDSKTTVKQSLENLEIDLDLLLNK